MDFTGTEVFVIRKERRAYIMLRTEDSLSTFAKMNFLKYQQEKFFIVIPGREKRRAYIMSDVGNLFPRFLEIKKFA